MSQLHSLDGEQLLKVIKTQILYIFAIYIFHLLNWSFNLLHKVNLSTAIALFHVKQQLQLWVIHYVN